MDQILRGPEVWPKFLRGTRRYLLRGYPYSVVFVPRLDVVWVLAIAHDKRRVAYWASRLLDR